MENLGFEALDSDVCLFKHREVDILVVLYVDDLLVAVPIVMLINRICDGLKAKFELKEMGEVKRFLGFDILCDRSNRKIFILQETYIRALLAKRGIEDCILAATLWLTKMTLPATGTWALVTERQKTYAKDTGAINWLSYGTRADIAYIVLRLAEANAGLL
jgi:hypothetical protein